MNQILDYTPNGSKRTNKNRGSNSDKVVRILAIFLMIFAVLLVGIAVYSRTTGKSGKKETPEQVTYTDAKISYEIDEEENKVKVKVSHDKVITKFSYNWDSGKVRDIDGNGKSEFETDLDLFMIVKDISLQIIRCLNLITEKILLILILTLILKCVKERLSLLLLLQMRLK